MHNLCSSCMTAVQLATDKGSEDGTVQNVRQSMQAAFLAVDNDDILNVSFDDLKGQAQAPDQNGAYSEQSFTPAVASSGPPMLSLGSDDIFWMSKVHNALLEVSHLLFALTSKTNLVLATWLGKPKSSVQCPNYLFAQQKACALSVFTTSMQMLQLWRGLFHEAAWRSEESNAFEDRC